MRYWDASALVPLCVAERTSAALCELAAEGDILTWSLSRVEIASAIERRAREGALSASARSHALTRLAQLSEAWTEITAVDAVRDRACRLVAVHPLRAADSLQLAAAIVAVFDRPAGHVFVCSDRRLSDAALREGFDIVSGESFDV